VRPQNALLAQRLGEAQASLRSLDAAAQQVRAAAAAAYSPGPPAGCAPLQSG
jgi:hypothetical protein